MSNAPQKPNLLDGTRDFLPAQMMQRNAVLRLMRRTFEQFGYAPIETPALHPLGTLNGANGYDGEQAHYVVTPANANGEKYALPSGLTVPFARFFSSHREKLPIPFKRYQMQRVWRDGRTQPNGLREFYHCDIDIVGSNDLICEAEIAKIIAVVFEKLQIGDITLKFNSRVLLSAVLRRFGVKKGALNDVMRLINKWAKVGEQQVIDELQKAGVADASKIVQQLTPATTNDATLAKLAQYDPEITILREFMDLCAKLGVPVAKLKLEPTLARDLNYYTGLVFEVECGTRDIGNLCAGGRYGELDGQNAKKALQDDFSGVGVAFEFEQIMLLLNQRGLLMNGNAPTQALIARRAGEVSKNVALKLYRDLIGANISAEIYLNDADLDAQLRFAKAKQIPFVLVEGDTANETIIKRLSNGKEKVLATHQVATYLSNYYAAH